MLKRIVFHRLMVKRTDSCELSLMSFDDERRRIVVGRL